MSIGNTLKSYGKVFANRLEIRNGVGNAHKSQFSREFCMGKSVRLIMTVGIFSYMPTERI